METADRIMQQVRMLGKRGGDPRVGQLQQRRASGAKKNGRLPIHPPAYRLGAEETMARLPGQLLQGGAQHLALRA